MNIRQIYEKLRQQAETELVLIHKDGIKTLSINQKSLSYESNDSYDND
jgi:hypothetical protein